MYGKKRTGTADSMERKANASRSAYKAALEKASKSSSPKKVSNKKKAEAMMKAKSRGK